MWMPNSIPEFVDEKWVLCLPFSFMLCDVITGFIKGWVDKNINSKTMRVGLAKKICELMLIIIVMIVSVAIGIPKRFSAITSIYVCLTEALSIIENFDSIGVPIPSWIRKVIAKANERGD